MIKFGKNKTENWKIFDEANQTDTLFHLEHFPSCYVIINKSINELLINEINECALLCKNRSKYKMFVKVFYTSISNLEKGDKEGMLIIQSNRKVKYICV